MAGGGGGDPFVRRSPEELARLVRNSEDETNIRSFETELSGLLNDLLSAANSRDTDLIRERLDKLKGILSDDLETTIDPLFGGSVAKHTYVDGMSDIDSLFVLNSRTLHGSRPSELLEAIGASLARGLGDGTEVSIGKLAITLQYRDGMTIQVLPAFKEGDRLKVPSFRHDGWAGIAPDTFQKALTERNAECGGKLVPTVKLAKAIMGVLPESQRLTGYHVESLAISAFRDYKGPYTTAAMLPVFFEKARELVMSPIRDSSGQSIHVDGYLGAENGSSRAQAGHVLSRIAKRMRNASAHMSKDQWSALFGLNNG